MLPALAAGLAGYASRDWCEPFVPTVASPISARGHPVPAPLAKLSGFWRCGFAVLLVSWRLHLNGLG